MIICACCGCEVDECVCKIKAGLSDRIRPNSEAAPWVIDEVKRLETELAEAYEELRKQRKTIKAVFNRIVWDRAEEAR